jgi:glutathione S-transferase
MQLIGQFDSPFVRRVGIALTLYGMEFEHLPWSVFGDWRKFASHNPLRRVPTLLVEGELPLIDSAAILDYLDEQVGPERALIARSGPGRRAAMRRIALVTGAADKAVSFFYAKLFSDRLDPDFIERSENQILQTVYRLEEDRATHAAEWWYGDRPGHDDIAVACVMRFLSEAYADLVQLPTVPALADHCGKAEALPVFRAISQPFIPPQ